MSRLGNDGTVRANALVIAKQQANAVPELPVARGPLRDAGLWDWQWIGPGNIGGRIRSILIHPDNPDIIYVGGVAGGIWKTTNGGASWMPLNDFLPSLAICTMVMDPDDPDIIYVGTGEANGSNPCEICDPNGSGGMEQWTAVPNGTPCDDPVPGGQCVDGQCLPAK